MKRRTKIVATLGPATDTLQLLENLLDKGVDVVRINFSHGSAALHRERVESVRSWSRQRGKQVGILADLQGPKIRISQFEEGRVTLAKGAHFSISTTCAANHLKVKAIAAISASGMTALWMSRIRTSTPIYGLTNQTSALGRMTLYRNVFPVLIDLAEESGASVEKHAMEKLKMHGAIDSGDYVILTKGDKPGVHGGTNVMHLVAAS